MPFYSLPQAYAAFRDECFREVVQPLSELLDCFDALSGTASEFALREFLASAKTHAPALRAFVQRTPPAPEDPGVAALADYG